MSDDNITNKRLEKMLVDTLSQNTLATDCAKCFLELSEKHDMVSVLNCLMATSVGGLLGLDTEVGQQIIQKNIRVQLDALELNAAGAPAAEVMACYTQHPGLEDIRGLCQALRGRAPGA